MKIALNGAAGRMGQRLVICGIAEPNCEIVAAIDASSHPKIGTDAGQNAGTDAIGISLTSELPENVTADAVIDFSQPAGMEQMLKVCVERKIPMVIATTGLSAEQIALIDDAAKVIPIVFAPNMSMGVNVCMKLAQIGARALAEHDADVEILERHHRFKKDSPSGTALKIGELVANEMNISKFRHGREGIVGERPHDEIAYHAIRTGDNPGEHTVVFGMMGETLEVTVRCSSRDGYAKGAYAAARFLQGKEPGRYDMFDVLDLK
ncbi:MAG: 4-hydroxy-tetrahydrodipicolinate reductase [Planctomycetia bacterium]|nr:4-hydroxy-tetrahydrodipicolinate reductase [Planctomycetia bacterium]